jgi:DNA invertase Pin-like site-specific DNA recombinase/transcriptional antiterminator Rof (Rho-off)
VQVRDRFDDGGLSGGTLERPALARLLTEIEAGRIGMVVVYKIDRLTRSLADFARLVERFDAAGCSFVSVTQAFNTSTSMGRLTLNVLLSFAQFEREVTAERIRDKIAASKKQGLWMGGVPPLGYDPHPDPNTRELVVNGSEAETVRTLFQLYDQLSNLSDVAREADRRGLRSKRHSFRSGRVQGGGVLSNGQVHKILTNPVYAGRIRHKDQVWPGRHAAIVSDELWDRVQSKLQKASRRKRGLQAGKTVSPLTGKLQDETGDRLTPTHATKAGKRHRYYVSNRLISGGPDKTAWRLPAEALERRVRDVIADHLETACRDHRLVALPDLRSGSDFEIAASDLITRIRSTDNAALSDLLSTGTIGPATLTLTLDRTRLAEALGVSSTDLAEDLHQITADFQMRRRGVEAKLIIGERSIAPDPVLLRTLRDAHRWVASLKNGVPLAEIARGAGHHDVYIRTRGQLAFLSPRIQKAIVDGSLPPEVTLQYLATRQLPLDWTDQERLCGLA